jgi:serine/threonine-protein kinase
MICPECSIPNSEGARFCNSCGATLLVVSRGGSGKIDALLGRIIDGRYRLDFKLGSGGMGAVYSATRLSIGDEVAIKILHQDHLDDPQAAGRFRREAQTAARLKHPNAVSIYDFGITSDGLQYLVMELIEGQSLRDMIKMQGRILPSAVAEIAQQLCAALDEAHRQNIVHRDVKPDNIIIHLAPGGLRVKVLDFGIAKLKDKTASNLTQTGSVMGTPHYMSPEQCLGEELDCRADIYSLGCVLYEMLCGTVPFNAPVSTAVAIQHVNQAPPPLREKNPAISPEVERVVLRTLEKRPEARPVSAGAVAKELTIAVNHPAQSEGNLFGNREIAQEAMSLKASDGAFDSEATVLRDAALSTPVAGSVTAGMMPTVYLSSSSVAAGAESVRSRSNSRRVMAAAIAAVVLASVVGTFIWLRQPEGDEEDAGARRVEQANNGKPADEKKKVNEAASERTTSAQPTPPPEMVYVPGGEFMMGRDDGDPLEQPQHRAVVNPFFLDRYEVTCAEYQRFVSAMFHRPPPGWVNGKCPPGAERRPVVGVDWYDATAYARWAQKRLPTEEEWEFAARGTDGRLYPWGNEWQRGLANADGASSGIAETGTYKGQSPFGNLDMVGNAWEWTATDWTAYEGRQLRPKQQVEFGKVIRGGSYENDPASATTTYRQGYPAKGQKYLKTSFRCAKDVSPSSTSR